MTKSLHYCGCFTDKYNCTYVLARKPEKLPKTGVTRFNFKKNCYKNIQIAKLLNCSDKDA
jgi:hypothetical protein